MPREKLELGATGELRLSVQRKGPDGKWTTADRYRKGDRWRARCRVRGFDGVLVDKSAHGSTRAEAEARLRALVAEHLRGATDVALKDSTPLVDAGRVWFERLDRPDSGRTASTVRVYRMAWDTHVVGGGSPLAGLTLGQVNNPQRLRRFLEWVADRDDGKGGTGAAKQCRAVLSGLLRECVEAGVLPHNSMRDVRPVKRSGTRTTTEDKPRAVRDHRRAFTPAERERIMAWADEWAAEEPLDPRSRPRRRAAADLTAFMAGTGVRIAEARALRWDDVVLTGNYPCAHVHGTKTASADRTVPLPRWLAERLSVRATESGTDGLVFPAPGRGEPVDPERPWEQSNASHAMREVLDGAGFPWAVPHTFRRTVASILADGAVPVARIADQLGHSNPAMTQSVYLGRDPHGDRSTVAALL